MRVFFLFFGREVGDGGADLGGLLQEEFIAFTRIHFTLAGRYNTVLHTPFSEAVCQQEIHRTVENGDIFLPCM